MDLDENISKMVRGLIFMSVSNLVQIQIKIQI